MRARSIVTAALLVMIGSASAQPVYESRDKAGPVFSDKPSAGASAVALPPPNVISPPPAPATPPPASAPPPTPYRDLVILAPQARGSIHSNTGAFDIRARLSPALRGSDRIVVSIDGNPLKARYRGPNVHVTEADWNAAANGNDSLHTIQLTVVDANGAPLIASEPVGFYMQRATVSRNRRAAP